MFFKIIPVIKESGRNTYITLSRSGRKTIWVVKDCTRCSHRIVQAWAWSSGK